MSVRLYTGWQVKEGINDKLNRFSLFWISLLRIRVFFRLVDGLAVFQR